MWRLGRSDYWAPLVVVRIVAGMLMGPGVLGHWYPDIHAFVFSPETIGTLNGIVLWAVILFVWMLTIPMVVPRLARATGLRGRSA